MNHPVHSNSRTQKISFAQYFQENPLPWQIGQSHNPNSVFYSYFMVDAHIIMQGLLRLEESVSYQAIADGFNSCSSLLVRLCSQILDEHGEPRWRNDVKNMASELVLRQAEKKHILEAIIAYMDRHRIYDVTAANLYLISSYSPVKIQNMIELGMPFLIDTISLDSSENLRD